MNPRILKVVGCLVFASIIFGACAPAAGPTAAPVEATSPPVAATAAPAEVVTIDYLEHFTTEWGREWFDKTIAGFEAEHPNIKINLIEKPYNDLWPFMLAGAQAKDLPDIIQTFSGWMATLGEYNALYDLKPLIDSSTDAEYIANTGATGPYLGTYKGEVLGASWGFFVKGIYYNTKYFEDNNLEVPTTWAEFEELLKTLKATGLEGFSPIFDMIDGPTQFPYDYFGWRLVGAGGHMVDDEMKAAFNSPEGKLALEYWKRLNDEGLLGPNPTGESTQQARGDFCSGKVPMILDGPWIKSTCETLGGTFTIGLFPQLCGEKTCGILAMPQYLSVAANSEHPEAAFEFIQYMQSDAVTSDWTKTYSMTTTNPAYFGLSEVSSDPILGPMAVQFGDPDNGAYPAVPNAEAIQQAMMSEFQSVLLLDVPIETALANMEAKWNELMVITE